MSIQCQEMSFSYFDKALVLDFFDLAEFLVNVY